MRTARVRCDAPGCDASAAMIFYTGTDDDYCWGACDPFWAAPDDWEDTDGDWCPAHAIPDQRWHGPETLEQVIALQRLRQLCLHCRSGGVG
jgi:hypothetical protein